MTERIVLLGFLHFHSETGTEGGYWAFQSSDNWSYEGLHILKNGDQLKIFSNESPTEVVWKGEIQLKEHGPFTEHVDGLWIHSDQIGVARGTWSAWFFKGLPAELTPS
jgi:hypothetical protein